MTPSPEVPADIVAVFDDCPACHQGILQEWPHGWSCSRRSDGCLFHLSRVIAGHSLTILEAYTLLKGEPTALLTDLRSHTGHGFAAQFVLANRRTGYVRLLVPSADSA